MGDKAPTNFLTLVFLFIKTRLDRLAKQKGEGVCYADIDLSQSSAKRVLDKLIKEGVVEEFKKPDEHKQKKFFRLVDKGF
jgi:predicted ArsR family transcriptional regulator